MIIRDLERIETAFESAREHAAATEQPADQARVTQGAISESAVLARAEGANCLGARASRPHVSTAPKAAMRGAPFALPRQCRAARIRAL